MGRYTNDTCVCITHAAGCHVSCRCLRLTRLGTTSCSKLDFTFVPHCGQIWAHARPEIKMLQWTCPSACKQAQPCCIMLHDFGRKICQQVMPAHRSSFQFLQDFQYLQARRGHKHGSTFSMGTAHQQVQSGHAALQQASKAQNMPSS